MPDETQPDPDNDPERDPESANNEEPILPESMEGFPELPKIIKFDSLARCGDEVWIEHNGQIYRLRKTRQEKLILTK